MLVTALFVAFTWTAKELPALYVHEPWQDDPYDAVVSSTLWCIPLLVGLCLLRVALCRRYSSLPVRRALDVRRVSRVLVGAILVTLASDWASVVLQARRSAWTGTTTVLICLLALLTALAFAAARELRHAGRGGLPRADAPSQPDWLADALALGAREADRLGPWRDEALTALRWLDRELVARVRGHPLLAAGAFALAFGAAVAAPQVVGERYGPPMALFYFGVVACTLFAFVVIVGAHLRLVGRPGARPSRAVLALVLACTSVPLTVSFRDSLWWVLGTNEGDAGLTQLTVLLLAGAAATATLVFAGEPLVRGRRNR
jgi:hypothetical protein